MRCVGCGVVGKCEESSKRKKNELGILGVRNISSKKMLGV